MMNKILESQIVLNSTWFSWSLSQIC